MPPSPQPADGLGQIEAVEQADGVHDQSQGAELVLLALPLALAHLLLLAVEDLPREPVARLVAVELYEYPPMVGLVVDVGEQGQTLRRAAHLAHRGGGPGEI